MRILYLLMAIAGTSAAQPAAIVQNLTHRSQVMGAARAYRVYLPPSYATAKTVRYPVVYWLHGYEAENPERDAAIAAYVARHPLIVVDSGPADTTGQYPLYFPELVELADKTLRTMADRTHRGVTGSGAGGYLAIWQAAKSPDLVGSASSLGGPTEAPTGPDEFEVQATLTDLQAALDAVRVKQATAAAPVAEILDFHLDAFAHPTPKPASFSHFDPYPNFGIWNWEVVSDRRRPAFTVLENVSSAGFRSTVREWLPGGAALPDVTLSVTSPPLYTPATVYPVLYIRLRDGKTRQARLKPDARGRLSFDLDGDAYEVGVGVAASVTLASFEIVGASWPSAGKPVQARLKFWNKGGARSPTALLKWESPVPGVMFQTASARLSSLAPGESITVPVTFTIDRPAIAGVRIVANGEAVDYAIDIPVYPAAEEFVDWRIADGVTLAPYSRPLGEGNRDGHAAPGESFALLFPDAGALRAAELFTNDPCVDNTIRISDGGALISVPAVQANCEPGHRMHLLARVGLKYYAVEVPVWYRNP
ncbi:MAG: alpha/beta hydrolase-fold protein [Candidatus Solibacter sp.]